VAHLFHGSIAFSIQLHNTSMHLSPFWQQFKNSITLKIHSTSTSSVTSQQTAWFIKISPSTSCSVCISPCCARLTGVIISVGVHVTTVKFSATFYDTVQSHSIITTRMHQLAINFDVVKRVSPTRTESHYRPLHRTQFPVLLPLHSNLLHEQQLNN